MRRMRVLPQREGVAAEAGAVTDTVSPEVRSRIMSKIHSPTKLEERVVDWLRLEGVPHEPFPKVEGRPDVAILRGPPFNPRAEFDGGHRPLYLFLDGCFWHRCPVHYRRPKSRQEFWVPHVEESDARREERRRALRYAWVRIFEHSLGERDLDWTMRSVLRVPSVPTPPARVAAGLRLRVRYSRCELRLAPGAPLTASAQVYGYLRSARPVLEGALARRADAALAISELRLTTPVRLKRDRRFGYWGMIDRLSRGAR